MSAPTKPGWYWVRSGMGEHSVDGWAPELVRSATDGHGLVIENCGNVRPVGAFAWAGPCRMPKAPAPHVSGDRPVSFGCWNVEATGEITVISASNHELAATFFLMAEHAKSGGTHDNTWDAERIGVVDLESGECNFIYVRLLVDIVGGHRGASS